MFYTFLKISIRTLFSNKLYSLINLLGLTIGIACCLLISMYVYQEMHYDSYNKNASRIVLLQQYENSSNSGGKLATDMKARFSQVENTVRLCNSKPLIKFEETAYYEPNFYFADSSVFSVFTFPLVKGNALTALKEQYGLVISEAMARKYFGTNEPLGREISFNEKYKLHITGVMKNLPANSHLKIDMLAAYTNASELMGTDVSANYWGGTGLTYLLLAPRTDIRQIAAQFPAYLKSLNDENAAFVWRLNLVPLRDLYLKTSLIAASPVTYVYIFSLVGFFILALACFNYVNLSTARASARSKEVGIRKVMGSTYTQLRGQFILETALFILLAVILALIAIKALLPAFNYFSEKSLSLLPLFDIKGILLMLTGIAALTLLAGIYPAFVLSAFKPAAVLKGTIPTGKGSPWLRKTLVVLQFTVSMIMIAATLIVYQQLHFIRNKNVGYQRSQMLTLDLRDAPANTKEIFKQEIKKLSAVESATRAYGLPGSGWMQGQKLVKDYVPEGAKDAGISRVTIDEDYLRTFGIKLLEGRMLQASNKADKEKFLINKAAKQYFNWKNIDGKMTGFYRFSDQPDGSYIEIPVRGAVVGVIADYNHSDLKTKVQPMIFSLNEGWESQMAIRLKAGSIAAGIEQIKKVWTTLFPGKPFEYNFLDTVFENTYKSEERTARVFGLFACLAIIISCLGVLGLIVHVTNMRRKEIGIRKVLGASILTIGQLLAKEFFVLIIVGWFVAFPIAWWAMNYWLQNFAYRITIGTGVFAVTGSTALMITLFTISFQTIRAAVANPIKSLRSE